MNAAFEDCLVYLGKASFAIESRSLGPEATPFGEEKVAGQRLGVVGVEQLGRFHLARYRLRGDGVKSFGVSGLPSAETRQSDLPGPLSLLRVNWIERYRFSTRCSTIVMASAFYSRCAWRPSRRNRPATSLSCAIHRFLFSPIYDRAGEPRTVDIRKNLESASYFVPVSMIERAAGSAADELRAGDYLRGMDRAPFIARLAHHCNEFNDIQPFREGSGRTQRRMWDRIARDAGWRLSWLGVTGAINDSASHIAPDDQDIAPLIDMFDRVVAPLKAQ